jgi:flavodoxin/NAD-dependent dihydropyrimidine dehydrogenase PreA subunit
MNIILYAFSGSGNTFIVEDALKKHLEEAGHKVTVFRFHSPNENVPSPSDFDMVGIGYPIHAFNVPKAFYKFIRKLPPQKDKKYFIFKVSGEPFHLNDASSYHFTKYLDKHGYIRVYEKHFLMPYNIMFKYKEGLEKQMYLYIDPLAKAMSEDLSSTNNVLIKYHLRHIILSFFLRIEWIAAPVNRPLIRVDMKKCAKCLRCVKECPTAALIYKDGKIKMGKGCALCMRCTLNCPKNAIRFGFLNNWKVTGGFQYERILSDPKIDPCFINKNTTGYFKKFRKYYKEQNEILRAHSIPLPITYKDGDEL